MARPRLPATDAGRPRHTRRAARMTAIAPPIAAGGALPPPISAARPFRPEVPAFAGMTV
ncbi:hypothetical protein KL86PLE_90506 [uncultured Pleomorphomonas sp.]|uniref:Uncharacterized protein n=1 Tax=uncultured Pleomorphomonas sp. TaxID=442121 RepID=A0A212LPU6_9HYPH|nr:hypothetical protein KL86PLE_90506 [uncultured Pleomorphomonas sp.]